ncbi:MAG: hypothetical protein OJF49_002318 [Ktedonobacterales bacterium]|jgi:hypothetical protein|nr:MAG: hypothetical protein OJF49_002318 [Ktedonobacterales bacterium]
MLWEGFLALLGIWALFLVLALVYLARIADGGWGNWGHALKSHITAERRAHTLMREMLSPEEYQHLTRHGFVELHSPSLPNRTYRIPAGGGLVRVYEQGRAVMDLCLQPLEPLPDGDVVVMHKLMIEGNEEEYLARANHFAPGIITLRNGYL